MFLIYLDINVRAVGGIVMVIISMSENGRKQVLQS